VAGHSLDASRGAAPYVRAVSYRSRLLASVTERNPL